MALKLTTAGESHGPGLTCVVEGLPAGLVLDREAIDADMARRQLGHGRGGRMKIERDSADVTAGVRHGRTLGGPVALQVANRDYANWADRMSPWPVEDPIPEVHAVHGARHDLTVADHLDVAAQAQAGDDLLDDIPHRVLCRGHQWLRSWVVWVVRPRIRRSWRGRSEGDVPLAHD